MNNINVLAIQTRIEAVLPTLREYQRRRYLSAEAQAIGYGGISLISRISGMSRQTLTEGVKELGCSDRVMPEGRNRKPGGGRKPVWKTQAGILDTLEELVSAHTKGDPMGMLLWTNKSLRNLEKGLTGKGYKASYRVVGEMLKRLGYGLQADKKTLTVTESPDGGEIEIWGDGEQTRTFLYVDECLEGIRRLMESKVSGPVNIGSDELISINGLAEMAMGIAGKKLAFKHIPGPLGVRGRSSDNTYIQQVLGWRPRTRLIDGMKVTYPWIAEQVLKRNND